MFRLALSLSLAGLLSACATTAPLPPPPTQTAAAGTRVGIVVTGLDQSAIHQHVGTTVFNNFAAEKTLPWHLGERVKTSISSELKKRALEPVLVEAAELRGIAPESLVVNSASQTWEVPAASAEAVRRLQATHKIDALIVVSGKPTMASLECGGGGCIQRVLPKTGLFTRSLLSLNDYYVVPGYGTRVLLLKPAADLTPYDPVFSALRNQSIRLSGDAKPNDPRSMTDADFSAVFNTIDAYTQNVAAAVAESIKAGPKLPK